MTGLSPLQSELRIGEQGLRFLTALVNAEQPRSRDLLALLEKPWKWDDEYAWWLANGRPVGEDDDGFAAWLHYLNDRAVI